jgi:O-6-methylguanine DNA methyltransferase
VSYGKTQIYTDRCHTPIGWFRAISDSRHLIRLDWNQSGWLGEDLPDNVSRETVDQLDAYFRSRLHSFNLPLCPVGVSETKRHWLDVMATIPFGITISYTDFANAAGHPKAARTAGSICATNSIPIIYPCHRVLLKSGELGNYGGGSSLPATHKENLLRKAFLINHEEQQLY